MNYKDYYIKRTGKGINIPQYILHKIRTAITGKVLDVGTGDGKKLKFILSGVDRNKIKELVAIEPSELNEIARAELKQWEVKVIASTLEEFDTREKFGTILMFEVIEHIKNHDKTIEKVLKLLDPMGIFIISTPNKFVYHIVDGLIKGIDKTHVSELTYIEFLKFMQRYFEKTEFLHTYPFVKLGRTLPIIYRFWERFQFLPLSYDIYCFASAPLLL